MFSRWGVHTINLLRRQLISLRGCGLLVEMPFQSIPVLGTFTGTLSQPTYVIK